MIRVGMVGAGPWSRLFHAPMLSASESLSLTAIWARRSEAAQALATEFGTDVAGSFDDLLDRCDAVAFTVPPSAQPELAVRAARAGKHLLLEKPLAFAVADAESIAAAVEESGVSSRLVLTYRFTTAARDFLSALTGTEVRAATGSFVSAGALEGSPFATAWRQRADASLFDLGPHCFDLLDAAAGPIERLTAAESGGVVAVTTRHANGADGHLVMSGVTPGARGPLQMTAVTAAGRFVMGDPDDDDPVLLRQAIAADFAAAIDGRPSLGLDVQRGLALQRLLVAAESSLRSGGPVTVD